jgi:iron complex transport system ATP-binding protein
MTSVVEFTNVSVVRDGKLILDDVTWVVGPDERWVVIGPNGAGKTTLLLLAAAHEHPTDGVLTILGEQLGEGDVFGLRPRLGLASTAMARQIPPTETVVNVVMTAAWAVTGRWNEKYESVDEERARRVLSEWKLDRLADRRFGTLSDGEQKRTMIARAVMTDPELRTFVAAAGIHLIGWREIQQALAK